MPTMVGRYKAGLPVMLLILLAARTVRGDSQSAAVSVDDVVKAWEKRAQNLRSLRLKWTEPYLLTRWAPHSLAPWRPEGVAKEGARPAANPRTWVPHLSLIVDGDRIRFEKEDLTLSLTQQLVPQASVWVWTEREYRHLSHTGAVAYPRGHVSESIHATWHPGDDAYLAPLLMVYRPFHASLGMFENFAKRFRVVAGTQMINGRRCILLEDEPRPLSAAQRHVYVDLERDFLLVRLATTANGGGGGCIDFLEYEKQDDGNWALLRWKNTIAVGSIDGPQVNECALNAGIDASNFDLEFPPGTWVHETESPTSYIVKNAGERRVITQKERFSKSTYDDFLTTETGALAPGPDTTNDPAERLRVMAVHRRNEMTRLKGRNLWSIPVFKDSEIEVRAEPVGVVHPREPIRIAINSASRDAMLFGKGRNEAAARNDLAACLRRKIEGIDRTCGLSDAQKAKLELAGRGDIARLFERIGQRRPQLERSYDEEAVKKGELDPSVSKLCEQTQPLRRAIESGNFDDGSLFAKTLKSILTPAQSAAFDAQWQSVDTERKIDR